MNMDLAWTAWFVVTFIGGFGIFTCWPFAQVRARRIALALLALWILPVAARVWITVVLA